MVGCGRGKGKTGQKVPPGLAPGLVRFIAEAPLFSGGVQLCPLVRAG